MPVKVAGAGSCSLTMQCEISQKLVYMYVNTSFIMFHVLACDDVAGLKPLACLEHTHTHTHMYIVVSDGELMIVC